MVKSLIQFRAETLATKFRAFRRPALVIEFAGVPKAGKTSTLNHVYAFLRRCGFNCEVVVERASVCPIRDKKHFNCNVWTACTTLSQLLEKTQNPPRENDPDIFLDRGLFDAICWLSLLDRLGRITQDDRKKADEFLLIGDWTCRVSGVIAMSTNSKDALNREQGLLPVESLGGSIMNPIVLKQMGNVIKERSANLKNQFRIFELNTSAKKYSRKPKETCEAVTRKILDWITESIEEKILSAAKTALPPLRETLVVSQNEAGKLIETFERVGDFLPRKKVEADLSRIQPLPVVVVRNRSGHILRLVRKEREASNRLHKKIAVWAGGHVRREDGSHGIGSILNGAIRELREELRNYAKPSSLTLLGAVYIPSGSSTKKHIAFVYEW